MMDLIRDCQRKLVKEMNGQYFRYCDDMILVIDEELEDRLSNLIQRRIRVEN